jgi:iron-sulfur cluster insertion protein
MNNINITENTIKKVFELIDEEQNDKLKLRIFVSGGGCSGFQYGFTFDEEVNEDDLVFEKTLNNRTVTFLVDFMSIQYLQDATIDYKKDISGEQFSIKNPNATTTCGCGSSFAS